LKRQVNYAAVTAAHLSGSLGSWSLVLHSYAVTFGLTDPL